MLVAFSQKKGFRLVPLNNNLWQDINEDWSAEIFQSAKCKTDKPHSLGVSLFITAQPCGWLNFD